MTRKVLPQVALALLAALVPAGRNPLPAAEPAGAARDYRPVGLFVCKGPEPTPEREVNFPFVDGWLVRPPWSAVEPADGRFDWSYIEGEIALARRLKKKIALTVLGGPQAPAWVYDAGARPFTYWHGSTYQTAVESRIPVLWDETYLRKWTELVRALGKKFGSDEAVYLVHIGAATENGLEMQLPHADVDFDHWRTAGYSQAKAVAAWQRIIDAFGEAFPDKPFDLDVHPVLGSDAVARKAAAYGYEKFGKRFGVSGGWLSGKSKADDWYHAGMHDIVKEYGKLSFVTFQMIGNETRQPQRFARGGLQAAVKQGMGWGARYFEVWRADVLNPDLHKTLEEIHAEVHKGS